MPPETVPDPEKSFLLVTGLTTGTSVALCGFVVLRYTSPNASHHAYTKLMCLNSEGPSFYLTGDRERQRFLAFVSMLTAIFGVISNGLREGKNDLSVSQSIVSFVFNFGVQVRFNIRTAVTLYPYGHALCLWNRLASLSSFITALFGDSPLELPMSQESFCIK